MNKHDPEAYYMKRKEAAIEDTSIDTDPFGMYTGVPTEDPDDKPIQDVDDL